MKQSKQAYRFGLVPHRIIAEELGIAPHTVQVIEKRAIKKFKMALSRRGLKLEDILPSMVG